MLSLSKVGVGISLLGLLVGALYPDNQPVATLSVRTLLLPTAGTLLIVSLSYLTQNTFIRLSAIVLSLLIFFGLFYFGNLVFALSFSSSKPSSFDNLTLIYALFGLFLLLIPLVNKVVNKRF